MVLIFTTECVDKRKITIDEDLFRDLSKFRIVLFNFIAFTDHELKTGLTLRM